MNIVSAAADLLWSRVIKQYPEIKIALSEGGTGWIPYFLERVDRTYEMHSTWTMQDFGGKLPSEVFREHFLTCFISDPMGVRLRHDIGIDNICWECDYPHSDSMWPGAPRGAVGGPAARGRTRRRHQQGDPRERDALVPFRPVRPHPPRPGHGERAPQAGRGPRHLRPVPQPPHH